MFVSNVCIPGISFPQYQNSVTIKEKNCLVTLLQTTDFPTLPYLVELADSQNVIAVNT